MVLLITNKDDVTTDFIANLLNKIGAKYYRLNTEDLVLSIGLNFNINKNEYILLDYVKNEKIDLSIVSSVYYRRPQLPQINIDSLSEGENTFVIREVTYAIEGLYKILNDRFWISPVSSIREP